MLTSTRAPELSSNGMKFNCKILVLRCVYVFKYRTLSIAQLLLDLIKRDERRADKKKNVTRSTRDMIVIKLNDSIQNERYLYIAH